MFSNKNAVNTPKNGTASHHARKNDSDPVQSNAPQLNQNQFSPEYALQLQRTIGNQSTMRMVASLIQRELDFDAPKWPKGKKVSNLSSGVNPVYGVDNLVIKGLEGGGAQQQFASQVYGEVVEAPRTRAVQVNSNEGQEIIQLLTKKGVLGDKGLNSKVTVLLVMQKSTLRSMEDYAKELGTEGDPNPKEVAKNNLRKEKIEKKNPTSFDSVIDHIFDSSFFLDLGKIHAIDIFLGNSDRMDRYGDVAMQNVFINVENGRYNALGLDLDVEAASLAKVQSKQVITGSAKQGTKKTYATSDADKYKHWVLHSIKGAEATRDLTNTADPTDVKANERFGFMPGAMDSTDVTSLFDPAKIANAIDQFRASLERWFPKPTSGQDPKNERERRGDLIGTGYYSTTLWPLAHKKYEAGIIDGIAEVRAGMEPGGKYEKFYRDSLKNNPKEDVFDFAVLQIRNKYFELKQDPHHRYTDADIMSRLEAYAKRLDEGWSRRV